MTLPGLPDAELHHQLVLLELALAGVSLLVLLFVSAPYGRHNRAGWGPQVSNRVAWILMETPAVVVFAWMFALGAHRGDTVPLIFLVLWMLHYVYRTYIYPFRLRTGGKKMPLVVVGAAFAFQALNATVNGAQVAELGAYPDAWLTDPRFLAGVALFVGGAAINHHADHVLLNLRKPGETGYKIPKGGLYRWVTSPNYLGEILEWTGWALATWSLAGVAFLAYTLANLIPRAVENHRWYLEKFADYPPERKRLIPFVF